MSHDSLRNKALVQFPDGKMLLLCEVSCSNVTGWDGKRCWDGIVVHPDDSLFFTKETLKQKQNDYVDEQLQLLRDFNKSEVENGWATEYKEPTLESYDYCGTVYPGGSKIKNGKAFYGGRPKAIDEYSNEWNSVKRIKLTVYEKGMKTAFDESYSINDPELDAHYRKAKELGTVYTRTYAW